MTSQNSQLIKNFHVAKKLVSCELLPFSYHGVDDMMLERLYWGSLADLAWFGRVATAYVTVVGLPCGSAVVSAHVILFVWAFCSCSLLLSVIPFLSDWGFTCSSVIQRLDRLFGLVGMVLLRLLLPFLALIFVGPWFWLMWWLLMAVSYRTPILACKPLSICLGLSVCWLKIMAWLMNSLGGDGVMGVSFLFSRSCDSNDAGRCWCWSIRCWLLRLGWWWYVTN